MRGIGSSNYRRPQPARPAALRLAALAFGDRQHGCCREIVAASRPPPRIARLRQFLVRCAVRNRPRLGERRPHRQRYRRDDLALQNGSPEAANILRAVPPALPAPCWLRQPKGRARGRRPPIRQPASDPPISPPAARSAETASTRKSATGTTRPPNWTSSPGIPHSLVDPGYAVRQRPLRQRRIIAAGYEALQAPCARPVGSRSAERRNPS